MNNKKIILHLTPHMGGGIGKALSGIVEQSIKSNSKFIHNIICLEKPIKLQYINKICEYGRDVIICPTCRQLEELIEKCDIVQLNWINNSTIIKCLLSISDIPIRLITWYHNNGLFPDNIKDPGKLPPIIPKKLILASDISIFTTECSLDTKMIKTLLKDHPEYYARLWSIYSCGGFNGFPDPESKDNFPNFSNDNMSVGYFGTVNFSKLHPQYINFLKEVDIPEFKVKIIGEYCEDIKNELDEQCKTIGKPLMLEFTGYIPEPILAHRLSTINVLAYILNTRHYGTTENSLLEAMSMGIVPIVLDNPAEKCIVENRKTGLIVRNPKEFGEAIRCLYEDPDYRQKLGTNAARHVRKNFSIEKTNEYLEYHYQNLMNMEKRVINFKEIFRDGKS